MLRTVEVELEHDPMCLGHHFAVATLPQDGTQRLGIGTVTNGDGMAHALQHRRLSLAGPLGHVEQNDPVEWFHYTPFVTYGISRPQP